MTNFQTATNEQVAAYFGLTLSSNGFTAVDEKGRASYLTDLRTKMRQEANRGAKAAAKKVEIKAAKNANIEEALLWLNTEFDFEWKIRETQPGAELEDLRFYVVVGAGETYGINIVSEVFTAQMMEHFYADYKFNTKHGKKGAILINGGLSQDQLVELINDAIERHKIV
ncbi:inhibitor of host transcription [Vibrio phage D479]